MAARLRSDSETAGDALTLPHYFANRFQDGSGPMETARAIAARNEALLDPFTDSQGQPLGLLAIASLMAWGLGYFGQPHILARFKAVQSAGLVPRARRIAVSWVLITLTGACLSGLVGIPFFDPQLADAEKVFIRLVDLLFNPLLAGLCLAAILAAIMSTADSQLLVASSAFIGDIYRVLLRKEASQRELVLVGRLAVLSVAAAAFLLAMDPQNKVLDLVAYAWAGFGAAFGPAARQSGSTSTLTQRDSLCLSPPAE